MKHVSVSLMVFTLALCGCGSGPQGPAGPQGDPGPAASPSPVVSSDATDIADVVENGAHGNAYRIGLGQTELSPGLSCQVQKVSAGQCLSNSASGSAACVGQPTLTMTGPNYTYTYDGSFDQPNAAGSGPFNLIPVPLQATFENTNFRIVCTGYMVTQVPGWYEFEDVSDDGSIIYLDGATLYNDGNHAVNATPVVQSVYLDRDVHSIQVWYAQSGGGNFGLVLTQNNNQIDPSLLYH